MQSSKAKALVDSGEWESKDKLQIRLITGSHYNGRIGSTSISPSRVDRFCGKDSCTIASHRKAQVHILTYGTFNRDPSQCLDFLRRPSYLLPNWEDMLLDCSKIALGNQLALHFLDLLLGSGSSYLIIGNKISLKSLLLF